MSPRCKAAKPDLIFSSLLFADLPVFMKQAHAAGLTKDTKLVFPAAGWQHTLMKKEFTPEGMLFGHNTLYFANPNASPLQKEFVAWYEDKHKDYPNWEADRAYFAIASYKAAVEKAAAAKGGSWPSQDDVIARIESGLSVESLGGKGSWRKDHIADQTFIQGFTTHKNKYDFVTLDTLRDHVLDRPAEADGREFLGVDQDGEVQRLRRRSPSNSMSASPTSCSAASFTPPFSSWSPPGCSSFSACRRSSTSPAARSMRSAPISASLSSAMPQQYGMPPWLLLPALLAGRHPARPDRPAHRAAAAHRL